MEEEPAGKPRESNSTDDPTLKPEYWMRPVSPKILNEELVKEFKQRTISPGAKKALRAAYENRQQNA